MTACYTVTGVASLKTFLNTVDYSGDKSQLHSESAECFSLARPFGVSTSREVTEYEYVIWNEQIMISKD